MYWEGRSWGKWWEERAMETKENECSREAVVKHCWRVKCCWGLWQRRTEERLLDFETRKLQTWFGVVRTPESPL